MSRDPRVHNPINPLNPRFSDCAERVRIAQEDGEVEGYRKGFSKGLDVGMDAGQEWKEGQAIELVKTRAGRARLADLAKWGKDAEQGEEPPTMPFRSR